MDTTRRQLLAAIPAVGIAATVGQGQDAPAKRETWEYTDVAASIWQLEDREGLHLPQLFAPFGEKGYSVCSMTPGVGVEAHKYVTAILKRPTDKLKRVVWEFKSFKLKDDPRSPSLYQYNPIGAEGWEIFYASPCFDECPRVVHAQRPSKGVEVDNR